MHEDQDQTPDQAELPGGAAAEENEATFTVKDRRHWNVDDGDDDEVGSGEPARPTIIEEYRERTEVAEGKLQEYIEAFKTFKAEQEQFRERLKGDVERRVSIRFGAVVSEFLDSMDNLDLALDHLGDLDEADPLAVGVRLARDNFLATLERAGVEKLLPDGQPFDPNEAEAIRMDPVESADKDGVVTETLRPGYRLGESLIRPARVAVGRHTE